VDRLFYVISISQSQVLSIQSFVFIIGRVMITIIPQWEGSSGGFLDPLLPNSMHFNT